MATEFTFDVNHPGEMAAGIWGYSDTVTVKVENDPGGDDGEFEQYMRDCLAEWFDGAKVTPNMKLTGVPHDDAMATPEHKPEAACGTSELSGVLERVVILENANGVQIREDYKFQGHYGAANATCECGMELIVAPALFHADHKKGDPVMVCGDHGVHGYRFSELVRGQQPAGSGHRG